MSTRFFKSPSTASAEAAIAPAKLAAATEDAVVRWRTRSDGRLELVAMRGGLAERYLVNDDGTVAPAGSFPAPFWYRWGRRVSLAGWGISFLSILAASAFGGSAFVGAGVVIGFALFGGGALAHSRAENLEQRLEGGGWHEPTDLHGWVPRSGRQLAAVERIADDHDGVAFVCDTGGRTVDVYAIRAGTLELYWIDESGNIGLTSTEDHTGQYRLDRLLRIVSTVLWVALLAVGFLVHDHKLQLIGLLLLAIALVIFVGRRNERHFEIEQLMRQRTHGDAEFVEIRTQLEEDDGD